MEPYFSTDEHKQFLYKYLDKAVIYFEFGSGGSTYQANVRDNIKWMYSVESDHEWYQRVLEACPNKDKMTLKYVNLCTRKNNLGLPGPECTFQQAQSYPRALNNVNVRPDLVFVDGRFRVACALHMHNKLDDNGILIIDDYGGRPEYKNVERYYDIIEKCANRLYAFVKKPGSKVSGHDLKIAEMMAL